MVFHGVSEVVLCLFWLVLSLSLRMMGHHSIFANNSSHANFIQILGFTVISSEQFHDVLFGQVMRLE